MGVEKVREGRPQNAPERAPRGRAVHVRRRAEDPPPNMDQRASRAPGGVVGRARRVEGAPTPSGKHMIWCKSHARAYIAESHPGYFGRVRRTPPRDPAHRHDPVLLFVRFRRRVLRPRPVPHAEHRAVPRDGGAGVLRALRQLVELHELFDGVQARRADLARSPGPAARAAAVVVHREAPDGDDAHGSIP